MEKDPQSHRMKCYVNFSIIKTRSATISNFRHHVNKKLTTYYHYLTQACTKYGPRAKCGPPKLLIWPAKPQILFILPFPLIKTPFEYQLWPWLCQKKFGPAMRFELCTPDLSKTRAKDLGLPYFCQCHLNVTKSSSSVTSCHFLLKYTLVPFSYLN
jgi:hypothetical protein